MIKNLRSTTLFLVIIAALLLTNVQSAAAFKPDREFSEFGSFLLSDFCTFDVQFDELMNKGYTTVFYDKEGNPTKILITGPLKVRLTNTSNEKSMDVNISGQGKVTLFDDGTEKWYGGGSWLIGLFPGDAPHFQPRLFLYTGRLVLDVNWDGEITDISLNYGKIVDVCAALGD